MAISNINAWLEDPEDYRQGLEIALKHSKNKTLLRILAMGATRYNEKLLYREVEAIAGRLEADARKAESIEPKKPVPEKQLPASKPASDDEHMAGLERYWKDRFKLMAFLRQGLPTCKDPEERRKNCLEIVSTFQSEIIPVWDALDYYKQHRTWPPGFESPLYREEITPLTAAQLKAVILLRNLPPRITKARKAGQEEKAAELEALLFTVKSKLGYE